MTKKKTRSASGAPAEKAPTPEASEDKIVLSIEEDRKRLALQGTGLLLVVLAALFLAVGGFGAAQITGNLLYLFMLIAGLTVAWFCSVAMGKRFGRLFSNTKVAEFGEGFVRVYEKADPDKALVVSYKDIKNYKIIRQGKALRLLLAGDWVSHPSGFQLVDINRPFMADTLDAVEKQVKEVMRAHRVNER